jgi:uncharacterized protein YlxW (UPF0749 family)
MRSSYVCTSGQELQEMQVLNTRLLQLVEMLAAERDNVVQLQKRRELLSAQIRDIKVLTHLALVERLIFLNLSNEVLLSTYYLFH